MDLYCRVRDIGYTHLSSIVIVSFANRKKVASASTSCVVVKVVASTTPPSRFLFMVSEADSW